MTPEAMAQALRAAGFAGVEVAGASVYARAGGAAAPEFQADPVPGGWALTLMRPVRAPTAALAAWNASHPEAVLDIHHGETRLQQVLADPAPAALIRWGALAEALVAQGLTWRRDQRARGEGM